MTNGHVILIDFGSTYTKAAVVSRKEGRMVFAVKVPSTVKTDARIALSKCFDEIQGAIGSSVLESAEKLATSSAAGGLRMAVIGLTKTLSITAGRNTAFGAGAKILGTFCGRLSEEDLESLERLQIEILLFCGGYENGNTSIVLENADLLSKSDLSVPVIYGGNSQIGPQVRRILMEGHKECFLVRNIIPQVGELDVEPAEEIIRDVFLKRIINMKGLDRISAQIDGLLMPTPAAVLAAGNLLSQHLGDLMIVDIGGATTDIHSYGVDTAYEGARIIGASEPYAKRTVEGDLGMRESANSLAAEIGYEKLVAACDGAVRDGIQRRIAHPEMIGDDPFECTLDLMLAKGAAGISARRHCGFIEYANLSNCKRLQRGKNLTGIKYIIGTGGPIINSGMPEEILKNVLWDCDNLLEKKILLPRKSEFLIDRDYIFYAAGLLAQSDMQLALSIMLDSLNIEKNREVRYGKKV